MLNEHDYRYMEEALRLAEAGMYTSMPNPRVGCVIVRDGIIVGRGAHLRAGEPHAEVHALREAGDRAKGADVYVTLEPCSHHGRTPPCADALIAAGVRRVFAAMQDPNAKVAGSGIANLQRHGIEVQCGLFEQEARELNPGFISRMMRGRPFVRSKVAVSLDGRTALGNGVSQWITGEEARADVQHWRARSCAILTGVGTVLQDDPQMNVRRPDLLKLSGGRQPLRVVVDSRLRISPEARILEGGNTLVAYAADSGNKAQALQDAGARLIRLPGGDGHVDLLQLMRHLTAHEINEVLVEAGAVLNGALQQAGLIDEYLFYYAPVLLGSDARGMFDLPPMTEMRQRIGLKMLDVERLGADLRIRARPG
ncbi:MAG TPA: bifunctional diaminohydroxyphosphoribosylaminopyrimidine deaminase/5-amino-6-(5-phosphoribosylamino)uracil reductase RibD [Methylophilaceae bacterium]|jgi:diaminohydroxyphosphoribosylaminopyrimidine deaminase/5-amino-6-(5-phosphoribosylamino)uracil reductase